MYCCYGYVNLQDFSFTCVINIKLRWIKCDRVRLCSVPVCSV